VEHVLAIFEAEEETDRWDVSSCPIAIYYVAVAEACGKLGNNCSTLPAKFENELQGLYNCRDENLVPDPASNPSLKPRRWRIFGAALLLAALALVVIYTSQGAFHSPVALVVVAAIGFAAVLIQLRVRQGSAAPRRAPLWLNLLGIIFALAAVFADVLHLNPSLTLVTALGAVLCFATSGVVVLAAMRKRST